VSGFASELTITQIPEAWRLWRLEKNLIYQSRDRGRVIRVYRGFITDGPSVPQFLWSILPVWGSWSRAGVIHDYLCCLIAAGRPHRAAPTRDHADRIFLEAMQALKVGRIRASLLYLGVRIGTWFNVRTTMIEYNGKLDGCSNLQRKARITTKRESGSQEIAGGMYPNQPVKQPERNMAAPSSAIWPARDSSRAANAAVMA
jgi:Protein of unknown function (DUF1353)